MERFQGLKDGVWLEEELGGQREQSRAKAEWSWDLGYKTLRILAKARVGEGRRQSRR